MNKNSFSLVVIATLALAVGGCATSKSAGVYERGQAQHEMIVRMGVVQDVRPVKIAGTQSAIGAGAGAIVGGLAGSNVGQGKGSTVGAVLGAVAGGLAGSAIEQGVTREDGVEITVKLDNGNMIAITQAADEAFRPGDRVRVLSGGGTTRVSH
ncbi:MAG: glycine zipper 2TM domain-containing protein [Proteobacteria bacterium]|nr:glycine zipper 2TM domain-containing protein [Pseudomonadota bacterium]HQR03917.1 glycine zipper 2TM domain-containing protein [Rhodocyclaceae bacterium]